MALEKEKQEYKETTAKRKLKKEKQEEKALEAAYGNVPIPEHLHLLKGAAAAAVAPALTRRARLPAPLPRARTRQRPLLGATWQVNRGGERPAGAAARQCGERREGVCAAGGAELGLVAASKHGGGAWPERTDNNIEH